MSSLVIILLVSGLRTCLSLFQKYTKTKTKAHHNQPPESQQYGGKPEKKLRKKVH